MILTLNIRHQAIFAVGLHWHYPPAFPRIMEVLRRPEDDSLVLTCAATAVGSMAHQDDQVRDLTGMAMSSTAAAGRTPGGSSSRPPKRETNAARKRWSGSGGCTPSSAA